MLPIATLTDVLDDGAFITTERQRRLAALVSQDGPYADRYEVDLDAGTLDFIGRDGTVRTPAHVVGSAAPGPGTWLWAWHNVNDLPASVIALAERTRQFGVRFGLPELTAAEVPLRGTPRDDAREYALVAGLANGGLAHYTAEVGGGTVLALLVDEPRPALLRPSAITAAAVIGEALVAGAVTDHRRALWAYAELRGLGIETAGTDVVLTAVDGRLTVRLDSRGRITNVEGHFTSAPEDGPHP